MPDPAHPIESPPSKPPTGAIVFPLAIWLAVQLIALWIGVAQIKFSANFPEPAERLALEEMVIIQIAAGAILMPLILRDGLLAIMTIASSAVFILLAGFLSAESEGRIFMMIKYVAAWLAILALWQHALCQHALCQHALRQHVVRSSKTHRLAAAAATALALCGPLLWYLQHESFGRADSSITFNWPHDSLLGPIMGAMALLFQEPHSRRPWVFLIALATPALLPLIWRAYQQVVHKLSTKTPPPQK